MDIHVGENALAIEALRKPLADKHVFARLTLRREFEMHRFKIRVGRDKLLSEPVRLLLLACRRDKVVSDAPALLLLDDALDTLYLLHLLLVVRALFLEYLLLFLDELGV